MRTRSMVSGVSAFVLSMGLVSAAFAVDYTVTAVVDTRAPTANRATTTAVSSHSTSNSNIYNGTGSGNNEYRVRFYLKGANFLSNQYDFGNITIDTTRTAALGLNTAGGTAGWIGSNPVLAAPASFPDTTLGNPGTGTGTQPLFADNYDGGTAGDLTDVLVTMGYPNEPWRSDANDPRLQYVRNHSGDNGGLGTLIGTAWLDWNDQRADGTDQTDRLALPFTATPGQPRGSYAALAPFRQLISELTAGSQAITYVAPTLVFNVNPLGDSDNNRVVDAFDIANARNNLGGTQTGLINGLLNGDSDDNGVVDAFDIASARNNLGNQSSAVPGSGSIAAVPEPSTFVLLGLGAVGLAAAYRRRRSA